MQRVFTSHAKCWKQRYVNKYSNKHSWIKWDHRGLVQCYLRICVFLTHITFVLRMRSCHQNIKKSTKYIFFPLTILLYHVFCCTAKSAVTISNIGAGTRRLLNHFSAHNIIYVWIYSTTQIYDILRMNINLFISLCFILFYFFHLHVIGIQINQL